MTDTTNPAFLAGRQAQRDGLTLDRNPYIIGKTKLGNNRLSEEGVEWENGFRSAMPARILSAKELADARKYDLSPYRRKSNRYYAS